MASSSSIFLNLIFILTFISSSSAILVFPLTHSLSRTHSNTTKHLLKTAATRAAARHRRRVSVPLSPGSDYTLSFSIGSQMISLYMDTGSDVVWLPCHPFNCILCEGKYSPTTITYPGPLNVSHTANPVTCKSRACSTVHSGAPSSDLCAIAKCPLEDIEISDCGAHKCPDFYYAYGDGSFVGRLYSDELTVPESTPAALTLRNFTFGCAHSALGEPIGVAGFGRGALSLPAQLADHSPEFGNYFSYCLVSHSFDGPKLRRPSPLIMGRADKVRRMHDNNNNNNKRIHDDTNNTTNNNSNNNNNNIYDDFAYTPLLENPKHPYYYLVGLEGVSVGKSRIPAPASLRRVDGRGNGGMVVDSGTTFTMLPLDFYNAVVTEFGNRVGPGFKRANRVEDQTGFGPCYYISSGSSVPQVVLHFGGNSSVVMPKRNYFYEFLDGGDKRRVGCVMLMNGGDDSEGGPAGLLGNYQQQGFEVVYDLEKKRVGFARRKCSSLWDSLNQH